MTVLIWWIGALHVAVYAIAGTLFVASYLTWRIGRYGGFLTEVIRWKVARARWERRHTDGLTETEWQQGEPRP